MEVIHLSNKSSGLFQASSAASGYNESQYSYNMAKPSCNKAYDKWQKTTFVGATGENAWGGDFTCTIPPYGLARQMFVKLQIQFKPAAGGANKCLGF